MKHMTISPSAASFFHNEEAAPVGEALQAVNLRRRCKSVEVVGSPEKVGNVPVGHRILCVHSDGGYVTTHEGDLYFRGSLFHHCDAEVLEAHSIEQFLVVNTSDGALYFTSHGGTPTRLNLSDALPELHLSAVSTGTVKEDILPYDFATPLSNWRAPLPSADVRALAAVVRRSYQQLQKAAKGTGAYTRPILARYAVRMTGGEYLWLSAPVMIGHDTVKTHYRIESEAVTGGGQFTGISAVTLSQPCFKLGISVVNGVAAEWARLIQSVDIFVTDEADIADTSLLDYRIATTNVGTRRYVAELGPEPREKSAIIDELMRGNWHLIASCSDIAALAKHEFRAWGISKNATSVLPDIPTFTLQQSTTFAHTLTTSDCAAITRRSSTEHLPAYTMAHGGRLWQGGGSELLRAAWHTSALLMPPFSPTPCTITAIERVSTSQGDATIVSSHSYPFTPSAVNPLVCAPHGAATALRIEVASGQTTKAIDFPLTPVHTCALAATYTANLLPTSFEPSSPSLAVTQSAVVPSPGRLTVSHIAQPLITEYSQTVTGAEIVALAATERPIYSGGFGRHPLYVFTDQGIFVMPQSSSGALGEAKLMSRKALDAHTRPISGGGKIWFTSTHQQLCSIEGSKIRVVIPRWQTAAMTWNDAEHELWTLHPDGSLHITDGDGFFSRLTLNVDSMYYDGKSALAVMPDGSVLNICASVPTEQTVKYLSHPIMLSADMQQRPARIIWNIFGSNLHLRLTVLGEQGESKCGFTICSAKVDGEVNAPIALPLISPPVRTVRLSVEGTAPAGTVIYSADLYINTETHR
ncbi:MAG: hypothetical protein SO255_02765 [Sodaliphilus sp.]|nr:hypothetical protein [Sodaliphilus sp.]